MINIQAGSKLAALKSKVDAGENISDQKTATEFMRFAISFASQVYNTSSFSFDEPSKFKSIANSPLHILCAGHGNFGTIICG